MKILILDSFKDYNLYYDRVYKDLEDIFNVNNEVKRVKLSEKNINPCMGCFGCWMKKPGKCLIEDDSQEVVRDIVNSDVIVYFTPVVFGGYSSNLKKLLDRCICLISPFFMKIQGEMHHKKRYDKYPIIIGVGIIDEYNEEQVENFKNLVYRNSLNLHSPFQCAEVIVKDDNDDSINTKLLTLINNVKGCK